MGCAVGTSKKPTDRRRRLSVASVEGEEEPDSTPEDDANGLGIKINREDLLKLVGGNDGSKRRWSFGSMTDMELEKVSSRAEKQSELKVQGAQLTLGDLSSEGIGVACKKGLKPESPNQDSFVVICYEQVLRIYGVFDGHGRQGHVVSNYVKEILPSIILQHGKERILSSPSEVCVKSFIRMQAALVAAAKAKELPDCQASGCTCTIVMHFVDTQELICAHVGDSRCIVSNVGDDDSTTDKTGDLKAGDPKAPRACDLTQDHRPELELEKKRIEAGGGIVRFDGAFNHRVYAREKGVRGPGLNMSRAFGDFNAHTYAGLSAEPDVKTWRLRDNDKYLILCSDGVWEFTSSALRTDLNFV
jgi:serine/threonine protein phosphatase PrpC